MWLTVPGPSKKGSALEKDNELVSSSIKVIQSVMKCNHSWSQDSSLATSSCSLTDAFDFDVANCLQISDSDGAIESPGCKMPDSSSLAMKKVIDSEFTCTYMCCSTHQPSDKTIQVLYQGKKKLLFFLVQAASLVDCVCSQKESVLSVLYDLLTFSKMLLYVLVLTTGIRHWKN